MARGYDSFDSMHEREIHSRALGKLSFLTRLRARLMSLALLLGIGCLGFTALSILAHDKALNNQAPDKPAEVALEFWKYAFPVGMGLIGLWIIGYPRSEIEKHKEAARAETAAAARRDMDKELNKILQTINQYSIPSKASGRPIKASEGFDLLHQYVTGETPTIPTRTDKLVFNNHNVFDTPLGELEYGSDHFIYDDDDPSIIYFNPENSSCVVALRNKGGSLYILGTTIAVGRLA